MFKITAFYVVEVIAQNQVLFVKAGLLRNLSQPEKFPCKNLQTFLKSPGGDETALNFHGPFTALADAEAFTGVLAVSAVWQADPRRVQGIGNAARAVVCERGWQVFPSASAAAQAHGIAPANLSAHLNRKPGMPRIRGMVFHWLDALPPEQVEWIRQQPQTAAPAVAQEYDNRVINLTTGTVFKNKTEAAKILHISSRDITKIVEETHHCKGGRANLWYMREIPVDVR